ncbi:MAG: hypothetical protein BGP13_22370 [Sphingobacteriales bacterium 40-81]|nr:MAG: hypothetical protein BGP13_22370 [Sphingobacteriales bacterium 40-81]
MLQMDNDKSIRLTIWISRLVRWGLGGLFMAIGILYFNKDGWPAILFGAAMIITGFFRPKRCIGDSCELPATPKK